MYERDPFYLAYVRSFCCLICGRSGVDAHHQPRAGHGAMGIKVSDYRAVPLCRCCHDAYGRESRAIYLRNDVDIEAVICDLIAGYFFGQSVAYVKRAGA